ncbi:MAG: aminotransferase class V-fold PLP-dependent enzyme [Bryobacteraceae bacterium]
MFDRRGFVKSLSSLPVIGSLLPASMVAAATKRDYFKELGIGTFINAAGTYTTLTASLMAPEVVQAIEYASKHFVRLNELHDAAAKRITELIGCEAAMISSGAASALTCGTAGVLTGKNQEFIRRLPDVTGMKSEVIIQKSHRYGYDHAVRACGVKFVEVETAEELERAINPNTAMMLFFNANDKIGKIGAEEFVALGKKHGIPTMNDAAADVPPVENLSKYTKMGFDLVIFSGGKGIRGPQSAGLLLGRKDLIEAARMNTSPNSDTVARGQKVNKEELLGMMAAIERYVKMDHQAEWKEWERRAKQIMDSVTGVKSVKSEIQIPPIANHVPHIHLTWDESVVKITPRELVKQLREGTPSIEVTPSPKDRVIIAVWMLEPGQAEIVAKRVRELLKKAAA